ncbi:hypothetical protein M405DRAFT_822837 [Rhizopogon salebrosus TDB-379]|nr:hypothetical protein M405DRAFT_822837 [Rhizopogon salebrosus TDB-379]
MHFFVLSCAIALFLSLSSTVAALTNAQRLARGLPVLPPPKFGRALPGYAWTPTEKRGASPSPSPSPSPSAYSTKLQYNTARILVVGSDGQALGYLYNGASGVNGVNAGPPSSDLYVSYTMSGSEGGLIDLLVTKAAFPAPYYLGTTSNATLAPGSSAFVSFGNVVQTPANSPPVLVDELKTGESNIWTVDATTMELTAHYVNPDGSAPSTTLAYDTRGNSIIFVGDIDAYNAAAQDISVSPVTFYLAV